MGANVAELYTYPIKGCSAVSHDSIEITEKGLQYDREWLLVDKKGAFISQRRFPSLALLQPSLSDDELTVTAPDDFGSVSIPLADQEFSRPFARPVEFFDKAGTGIPQSDKADHFFSNYLGREVTLLRSAQPRRMNLRYDRLGSRAILGFADAFPILLTTNQSLDALNDKMERPVSMARFRPNIVINDDDLEPYQEDKWRKIGLGELQAFVVRACARCAVPNVNQSTGKRDPGQPVTKALRDSRHGIDLTNGATGDFFGQNLAHIYRHDQRLTIGDGLTVQQASSRANIRPLRPAA